jgi:dihydroxyacetone kinase-like protein
MGVSAGPVTELDGAAFGAALRAGLDGVVARGKAEAGDKTMFDAINPALDAWDAAVAGGAGIAAAAAAALEAADNGRDATEPLVARKGRASYLGERSAGHIDPGATSSALLFQALVDTVAS